MSILLYISTVLSKIRDNAKKSINKNKHLKDKEGFLTKLLFYLSVTYTFIILLPTIIIVGIFFIVITTVFIVIITTTSILNGVSLDSNTDDSGETTTGEYDGDGSMAYNTELLNLAQGLLTEKELNFYRFGILAERATQGYGGIKYLGDLDANANVTMLMGISSTETGMKFYVDGSDKDITKYPSDIPINNSYPGYGFMGLSPSNHSLDKMTTAQRTDMVNAYKPATKAMYDINYAPYATYFSMKHLQSKYDDGNFLKRVDKVGKIFTETWGLEWNGETSTLVTHFMLQSAYHGWLSGDAENELESYAHFWAMLLHATGDNNAVRSYTKWNVSDSKTSFSESSFRKTMFGTSHTWKNAGKQNPSNLSGIGTKISVNGTPLNIPVWRFLYEKYSKTHSKQWNQVWSTMNKMANVKSGYGDRQLNFHYGFNSFIQGNRVVSTLYEKIGHLMQPTGSNVIAKGNYKHEPSVLQAKQIVVGGKQVSTEEYLKNYYSKHQKSLYNKLRPVVGTATVLTGSNPASKHQFKYNTWGVPFQVQYPYNVEPYQNLSYGGSITFAHAGCMVYSFAYAVSSQLGVNVNPPEAALYLHAWGGITGAMSVDRNHSGLITALTGKKAKFVSASNSASYWAKAKEHLDNHNGIVIHRLGRPYASGINHYVVLLDSHDVNGVKMYSMYSSSSFSDSVTLHTGESLMKAKGNNMYSTLIYK